MKLFKEKGKNLLGSAGFVKQGEWWWWGWDCSTHAIKGQATAAIPTPMLPLPKKQSPKRGGFTVDGSSIKDSKAENQTPNHYAPM